MIKIDSETTSGGEVSPEAASISPEPLQQTTETLPQDQTVANTDSNESGFNQNFDPKTLTDPNLQTAYKQMQADYTRKMQEMAQERQKYESFSKYEPYIPVFEQMITQQQSSANPTLMRMEAQLKEAGYSDEAIQMMKMGASVILNEVNQTTAAEKEYSRIDTSLKEAASLDPRLNDSSLVYSTEDGEQTTFGQIVEELVAADPNWRQNPVESTKRAIKRVDALIGKAKVEGKEELSNQAKVKATKFPAVNSSPQGTVESNQPLSVLDAYEQAKKELGL